MANWLLVSKEVLDCPEWDCVGIPLLLGAEVAAGAVAAALVAGTAEAVGSAAAGSAAVGSFAAAVGGHFESSWAM